MEIVSIVMDARYDIRREQNGAGTVVDSLTRLPAATDGRDLTGLHLEDARDVAGVLNRELRKNGRCLLV